VRLYCGDCLEILPELEGIDAVVSDPPYGMSNDCDYSRFTGGPNSHGDASSKTYEDVVGDDKPFDPTPFLRYEKVVLWGSNHYAERLPVGTTLVWLKRFDEGFGSFLSDAEVAWMKGGHGVYCVRDTSMYAKTKERCHPCQKPVGLMRWCLERAKVPAGATVFDGYMGSGTTALACIQTGRPFIGCEVVPEYFDLAVRRIKAELNRHPLFEPPMA
jgi:DNA modification methylase